MISNTVTTIGPDAFLNTKTTKLTGLDMSKATSLVRIGRVQRGAHTTHPANPHKPTF